MNGETCIECGVLISGKAANDPLIGALCNECVAATAGAQSPVAQENQPWTIIADPATGQVFESRATWNDASTAFRTRRESFRPLTPETAAISTHDGCTVGENAAYLYPGEWMASDGNLVALG